MKKAPMEHGVLRCYSRYLYLLRAGTREIAPARGGDYDAVAVSAGMLLRM